VESAHRSVVADGDFIQGVLLSSLAGTLETYTDRQPKRPEFRFDRAGVIRVTVPFSTPTLNLTSSVDRVFISY